MAEGWDVLARYDEKGFILKVIFALLCSTYANAGVIGRRQSQLPHLIKCLLSILQRILPQVTEDDIFEVNRC